MPHSGYPSYTPDFAEHVRTVWHRSVHRLHNPGIISIPLSFITLVVVSLMTQKDNEGLRYIG
jgi:Na+(H+)/acetate symporter ActP